MIREQQDGDRYRDWDAAYVLGALVAQDRHDFELHLARCAECSASVAELAGLPGMLAGIPDDSATALLTDSPLTGLPPTDSPDDNMALPSSGSVLAGLETKIKRRRARNAALAAALALGCAASAVGITLALSPRESDVQVQPAGTELHFTAVGASAVTATGTLSTVGWGTRIDWVCRYAQPPSSSSPYSGTTTAPAAKGYLLVVTDRAGVATVAASWTAGPDSVVAPSATVATPVGQIRSVDIRWARTGKTALLATVAATGSAG
ncbi:zf-HC2 domain-containing protein [Paenarthrobacter sp. Z7-10]|uniref:anti-sigma factor family protein n=1 Tax=Paenarthrobacter sp. Z7-10 TaxID=2787635 RepID=UPI0022A8DEF5|nr:zf-HC2 domain-containing protein [Paenarthrobacter sp. Z7-10]MCZ2404833.1 zf-HC2 domain-containing protein [Paenarthrobacter sp. Z7-10]